MTKTELEAKVLKHYRKDAAGHRDICSIYKDKALMEEVVVYLAEPYMGKIDYVAAPEPSGYILGSMLAQKLSAGFIPIRNGVSYSLNSDECVRASFIDHNNRPKMLQIRADEALENSNILLVDDWIDTAATMYACKTIVEDIPASVKGLVAIGTKDTENAKNLKEEGYLRAVASVK